MSAMSYRDSFYAVSSAAGNVSVCQELDGKSNVA